MNDRDFCYWLQGFFEVSGTLNAKQVQCIKKHLALAFANKAPEGNKALQTALQAIHGKPSKYC
jgi:hypothetical protein